MPKTGLRLTMFVGRSRIFGGVRDMALETIDRIDRTSHCFVKVFAEKGDPILDSLAEREIPTASLPDALCGCSAEVRQKTADPEFAVWLDDYWQLESDVGITFYSGWLPKSLIAIPRCRFINIHPAPLPELTGYEAEKFHVLTDRRHSWGVIHELEEHFDTGKILAEGSPVDLPEDMTSMDVCEGLIANCVFPLMMTLDQFEKGIPISGRKQDESRRTYATRKNAFLETMIRWETDTHRKIDCRFRAFNAVEDEMILKGMIDGRLFSIIDIMLESGDFPGTPGCRIGRYVQDGPFHDAPVIRTSEGVAVLRLGKAVQSHDEPVYLAPEDMLPRRAPRKIVDRNFLVWETS